MNVGSLRFMNKNISPGEEKVTSPYGERRQERDARGVITPFAAALYSQEGARNFVFPGNARVNEEKQ